MDVVVQGAHVVGVALDYGLQRRHDLLRALLRRAIHMPQPPGMQPHPGLGEQRGRIKIVRILVHDTAHGVPVIPGGL